MENNPDLDMCRFGKLVLALMQNEIEFFSNEFSEDLLQLAVKCGAAKVSIYDPEVHENVCDVEPGDEFYEYLTFPREELKNEN